MIDASKYTAHTRPGKFEGEMAATEYFYEQMCNGDGETVYAPSEDSDDIDDGADGWPCGELFRIDADESEAFGLPIGAWFLLREDSQGFAYGTHHETRELAEQYFRHWLGL